MSPSNVPRRNEPHLAAEHVFIDPDHPFAKAIRAVAIQDVRRLLESTPSLVHARVRGSVHFDGKVWDDAWVPAAEDDCRSISAIGFAAFHGHANLASTLLEFGAKCDDLAIIDEEDERSAVHLAAWEGDFETLRVLLESRAESNSSLTLEPSLYTALAHGATDKVKLLLEHGAQLDIVTAAMHGDIETVRSFLDSNGANKPHPQYDRTPLEEAVNLGQLEVAELLVERGADIPHHVAASLGRVDEIEALLDKDSDAANRLFGTQPLLTWALLGGQLATMKLLLERGADPNGGDRWGVTPLRHASQVKNENAAAAVDLLVAAGADVNLKSKGFTPLAAARSVGNEAVVDALLRHGAEEISA